MQGRTDYTTGTLVLRIINESDADLELDGAALTWTGFAENAVWERGTTIRAGLTVDLRTPVPAMECDNDGDSAPTADLGVVDDDRTATVTADVTDPLSTLDRLHEAGCIAEQVERVADITVGSPAVEGEGRSAVAVVPLTFTPTGADGRVEVSAVSATPLLQPAPATSPNTDAWPLELAVDATSGTVTAELRIVPTRCDPHALAEDKVGTVLNLAVSLAGDQTGDYQLVPPDGIREAILDYVRVTCGLS